MNSLEEAIRREIAHSGPMRFDRFMTLALYHPSLGFYAKERAAGPAGREGDFFTGVSVGPLLGRLLARQFAQMWELMGQPSEFLIVEQGANDGQLAIDVLTWCRDHAPGFFLRLSYLFLEPFGRLRKKQRERCVAASLAGKINWGGFPGEVLPEKMMGVFFSNELIDALPVRVIRFHEGHWRERQVVADKKLDWIDRPLEDEWLRAAIIRRAIPEVEGYTTEINSGMEEIVETAGRILSRGYFVTIDYGFPCPLYYAPHRTAGTLTAYRAHRRCLDVLADAGEQDITAHVDFTSLAQAGEDAGWTTLGLIDQQRFLLGIAEPEMAQREPETLGLREDVRAWQTLTHPEHLGTRFQVLVQAKGTSAGLDGLQFARPGWPTS